MGGGVGERREPAQSAGGLGLEAQPVGRFTGAGMQAGASGVGADFVEGTIEVSQPVGDNGVGIAKDMPLKVEGE